MTDSSTGPAHAQIGSPLATSAQWEPANSDKLGVNILGFSLPNANFWARVVRNEVIITSL